MDGLGWAVLTRAVGGLGLFLYVGIGNTGMIDCFEFGFEGGLDGINVGKGNRGFGIETLRELMVNDSIHQLVNGLVRPFCKRT